MKDKPKTGWHKSENQLQIPPRKDDKALADSEHKANTLDYLNKQIKKGK